MRAGAAGVIERLAAFGLRADEPVSSSPLSPNEWSDLSAQVVVERIEGLFAAAVASGSLPVTGEQWTRAREMARGRALVDLSLERETARTARSLATSGVPYRVIKGPAWAHRFYPDPGWRGFGDVDVLVASRDWRAALEAVAAIGAKRVLPEIRPGFDCKFGKDATLLSPSGWEIDLHRTLVLGPYGFWTDHEQLFARAPAKVSFAGVDLPVMDDNAAFVHACYNAALADDPPRLAALRDVAQMALHGCISADETMLLASAWRGTGVVRRALQVATDRLGLPLAESPVGRAFAEASPTARDRVLLAAYRGPGRGYTSQLAGVVAIPGLRDKVAYLSALSCPQGAYLDARGTSSLGFLRRAVRLVRSR